MRLLVLLLGMRIDQGRDRIRHCPVFEERRQPQLRLNHAINGQCENDGNTVDGVGNYYGRVVRRCDFSAVASACWCGGRAYSPKQKGRRVLAQIFAF